MKYIGWIPTASGYLSFSNIRGQSITGRFPSPPEIDGSLDIGECSIRAERRLSDRPFARLRDAFGKNDSYVFLCRLRRHPVTSSEDTLTGEIFAFPLICEPQAKDVLKQRGWVPGVCAVCMGWTIHFVLNRNGTVLLDWGESDENDMHAIADEAEGRADETARTLTFETYSLLKDLIHNHKFHGVYDDSIVVPYKLIGEDSTDWQESTARNIHRAVVTSIRSSPAMLGLTNALGQLAYLETFLRVADPKICEELRKGIPNIEKIINARLERVRHERGVVEVVTNIVFSAVLALIATSFTVVQLLQIPCIAGLGPSEGCIAQFHAPDIVVDVVGALLTNLHAVESSIVIILAALAYAVCRRSILELYSQHTGSEGVYWHLMRFFFGLALAKGKYMALAWLTILAGFLLWVMWLVLKHLTH